MQIVLVIFALLTIAGAWSGWRRSPLYSHKITFQLVAVFLLLVAVILGGSKAIFGGSLAHSPTAQAILIGLFIIVVAVGATAGIIRITDSHVAQLPASARIVTSERHKIQRWIWRIVAYLVISGAVMLVLPWSWSWLPGVPAVLILLGAGPSLVALYMRARRLDLGMSQVLAAPWAHWQYSDDEWKAWAENQLGWERSRVKSDWKKDGPKILKAVGLMVLAFVGGALFLVDGSLAEKMLTAGGSMAFLLVFSWCFYLAARGAPQRRYRRLLAAPREVVFGDEGMFCDGGFSLWILSGAYLKEAKALHDAPARLVFVFRNFNGSSSTLVERRVPIPPGREADLATIEQKLSARCRTATVRLK